MAAVHFERLVPGQEKKVSFMPKIYCPSCFWRAPAALGGQQKKLAESPAVHYPTPIPLLPYGKF